MDGWIFTQSRNEFALPVNNNEGKKKNILESVSKDSVALQGFIRKE